MRLSGDRGRKRSLGWFKACARGYGEFWPCGGSALDAGISRSTFVDKTWKALTIGQSQISLKSIDVLGINRALPQE